MPVQDRDDLLHLQFTHGLVVLPRAVEAEFTDLADDVRAVVGAWLTRPGCAGRPCPLVTARLWLRTRLAADQGTRTVLQAQAADELLLGALATVNSGLAIVPLRKRLSA